MLSLVIALTGAFSLRDQPEVIDGTAVPIEITCQEDNPCWFVRMEYR